MAKQDEVHGKISRIRSDCLFCLLAMKLTIASSRRTLSETDIFALLVPEGTKADLPDGLSVPASVRESFSGAARELRLTDATAGRAKRVLLVGVGQVKGEGTPDMESLDLETLRRCGALIAKKAEKIRAESVTVEHRFSSNQASAAAGQALAEGLVMGAYQLRDFKSGDEKPKLKRMRMLAKGEFRKGIERGRLIGEANCFARRLQDTPANRMRPRDLVKEARAIAAGSDQVKIKVFDEKAMGRMKMGSLLSVSRGSEEPAFLIHLVYRPKKKSRAKACFVGKGLTFDAGGISLKPSAKMHEMKYDMSGGAAVLGAMAAVADLKPDVEVHVLVPASENLPDGKANKPGDLVTAMNGITIEILNTDAEGRLILADALAYAEKTIKPDSMIDLATLTGAVVVGLGHEYSGATGNDDSLIEALVDAGKRSGELVWPLPIHPQHEKVMKGSVGDLQNISGGATGAGSSTGGAFLKNFVGDVPWVHLDIAGSAWGAADRDYQGGASGTGVGVRLLLEYLENV